MCSGRSDDIHSTSRVHESSGVQVECTLERPSTTDGQTDVELGSDEQEMSRQEQHDHSDPTLDVAAVCWTDTVASTSTYLQGNDGPAVEQGDTSTTDGQTNVD
jgi:hypothetical protein